MLRTRVHGLLLLVLLVAPVVVAVPAMAAPADAGDVPVLAVEDDFEEEEEDAPPPGPEPRFGEDSPFGPAEYEVPWTYGMGIALTAVAVIAVFGTVVGYWYLVRRPEREGSES